MTNIAIDGPSGAGKSTVSKAVAKALKIIYLDTGAMYRGAAVYALEQGADVTKEDQVKPLLESLDMKVVYGAGDVQEIYVNGKNVTPFIREHHISKAASDISALPAVRYKMVELQRKIAAETDIVLDGRDIGTFVLPNASNKFFLVAAPEERAKRRWLELKEKGLDISFETVLEDIKQRDYNDSHRALAPLKQADDAVLIDTTSMTVEEVIAEVIKNIKGETNNA